MNSTDGPEGLAEGYKEEFFYCGVIVSNLFMIHYSLVAGAPAKSYFSTLVGAESFSVYSKNRLIIDFRQQLPLAFSYYSRPTQSATELMSYS